MKNKITLMDAIRNCAYSPKEIHKYSKIIGISEAALTKAIGKYKAEKAIDLVENRSRMVAKIVNKRN